MEFNYSPPPPPPSQQDSARKRPFSARNPVHNSSALNAYHETSLSGFIDLPTHLPNDEPVPEPQPSVPVEHPGKDHNEDDSKTTSSGPVFIQGTNITLQTEEDIANWIAQRKKNWPTKQNLETKQRVQTEQKQQRDSRPSRAKLEPDTKKPKNICRFFQQHNHCRFGDKCKNIHESGTNAASTGPTRQRGHESTHVHKTINGIPVLIPKLYAKQTTIASGTAGSSLFTSLVKKDQYENENKLVIDFIRYLEDQGLIDHDVMKKPTSS